MKNRSEEVLNLAEEIFKNIELYEISLNSVAMKCLRLARLSGHQGMVKAFQYELSGYPKDDKGLIIAETFHLARILNRTFTEKDDKGKIQEYMFTESPAELEYSLEASKKKLEVSTVPIERISLPGYISKLANKIGKISAAYYRYALEVYYRMKFGAITEEIFNRIKRRVDKKLQEICPDAFQKFVTVYENLTKKEEENWANAVHSCRRILLDVANSLFPPSKQEIVTKSGKVKLDKDHYILRLKEYIKSKSKSETFTNVVGSTLDHIGDRIDSIYESTTKGTHHKIEKKEAERYVIHTYLLIGDILSLEEEGVKLESKKIPSKK